MTSPFLFGMLKLPKEYLEFLTGRKNNKTHPKTHKHPGQIRQRDGRNWYWEVRLFLLGKRWDLIVSKCPGFTRVPFFKRTYYWEKPHHLWIDISIVVPQPQIHSWICWLKQFTYIYIYTPESSKGVKFEPLGGSRSRYIIYIYIYTVVTRIKLRCRRAKHLDGAWACTSRSFGMSCLGKLNGCLCFNLSENISRYLPEN